MLRTVTRADSESLRHASESCHPSHCVEGFVTGDCHCKPPPPAGRRRAAGGPGSRVGPVLQAGPAGQGRVGPGSTVALTLHHPSHDCWQQAAAPGRRVIT
jgi:hypothetical protein